MAEQRTAKRTHGSAFAGFSSINMLTAVAGFALTSAIISPALAQQQTPAPSQESDPAEQSSDEADDDNIAAQLNAAQTINRTYTLTRSINGEVVETDARTVTIDGKTADEIPTLASITAAFDGEVLTRTEAFEEAKTDFALADANQDNFLSSDEFANLVVSWRNSKRHYRPTPTSEEAQRDQRIRAFLDEIDPMAQTMTAMARARDKFRFMAGVAPALSQKDYISEVLVDFDAMDQNGDLILKDTELARFRAANCGETHPE